jgi:hypothetical protein
MLFGAGGSAPARTGDDQRRIAGSGHEAAATATAGGAHATASADGNLQNLARGQT